jgi:hypothetical protein
MRALVVSNCCTASFVYALKALFPDSDIRGATIDTATEWLDTRPNRAFQEFLNSADLVITGNSEFAPRAGEANLVRIPLFQFRGLHPDSFHLYGLTSVLKAGNLFSRIATVAFILGMSCSDTSELFREEVYKRIGYIDAYEVERSNFISRFNAANINLVEEFARWESMGKFLYSYNHPKSFVLNDILCQALRGRFISSEQIEGHRKDLNRVVDHLAILPMWPVYTGIGRHLGICEPYVWRTSRGADFEEIALDAFIARTFAQLSMHPNLTPDLVPGFDQCRNALVG